MSEFERRKQAALEELERQRSAAKEAQDTREIQLLEKEVALDGLQIELECQQTELESQGKLLREHRRSLAFDQARHLSALERSPGASPGTPASFSMCDDESPLPKLTGAKTG